MLIGINPILTPDLLRHLRAMGHGDQLVIADANFPAETCATRIERLPGISATQALSAILTIMPLDTYVDAPARSMQVVGSPNEIPDIVKEFQTIINKTADNPSLIQGIERHEFYVEANNTYCIIQTSETRFYGNIILSKGVVSLS
ncbi:MAG: ribose ABC transporter [Tateyamaria sp.]|jgi:L-fucose mutarotase|nr:ribose ABC transporter [Tateyamaria sp.]MBT5301116.1 ribose ABC transporter [Tateyamaria sp.]MBT6267368.1 ribose ABC transporter [Tateyamaria sp.]MBT6343897.1 ribose ABC transporter [Tateyamaria sp.]MBT7447626.1 ribose ABC transporter [Tateyamaria sp.]